MKRTTPGHEKKFPAGAVDLVYEVENTFVVTIGVFQQDGSRAIPKQNAGGAILIIQNGSHHIASNGQCFFLSAGAHKLRADGEGIEESGTGRRKIESPCARCP